MAVSLKSIRTFVVAARAGSFTRAARTLNISQGAVSQQIARLENQLGVALIDRSGRKFSLTHMGRRLMVSVADSVDRVDRAVDNLFSAHDTRELSITSLASFAAQWLVPRLTDFAAVHSGIKWRIDTSPGLWDLELMNLDIGIRIGQGRWHGLRSELLFEDQLVCVAAPTVVQALSGSDPAAVVTLPLIFDLDEPDEWSRWLRAVGVDEAPNLACGYSDALVMLSALREGQGVGLIRDSLVTRELHSGSLVRLFDAVVPAWGSTWLVSPSGTELGDAAGLFRDWLMGQAQEYSASRVGP